MTWEIAGHDDGRVCAEGMASRARRSSMYQYVYVLEELSPACEDIMVFSSYPGELSLACEGIMVCSLNFHAYQICELYIHCVYILHNNCGNA